MKKVILLCFIILIFGEIHFAQTIFSNGSGGGDWNSGSTWVGGAVPAVSNDVIIAGTDSVSIAAGAMCNSLTVLSGGIIKTSIDTIYVADGLTVEGGAIFYNNTDEPTLPGEFIFLDPASTVVHTGSGTVGGEGNLEFGNLVIRRIEGCVPGGNLLIQGDLIVDNFAHNVVFRGARPQTGSQEHTVLGDVYINRGTLSCIDVGDNSMVGIWNFEGNVYVTDTGDENYLEARIGCFSSANAAGLGIINIGGDLIIDGGRLQAGTSSTPGLGTGIINIGGDFKMSPTSGVSANSIGPFALNFNGTNPQTVDLELSFSMSTIVSDTIKPGANVVFDLDTAKWSVSTGGSFVVDGTLELKGNTLVDGGGSFTVNPGASLGVGSPNGITLTDATGSVQTAGPRTFSGEADYTYTGSEAQVPGDGLPSTVNGLAVNNPNGLTLNGSYTAINSVTISNGNLDLNGNTLTLGESGTLTETPGSTVKGDGKVTTTRNIGVPSALNVGGLGAELTAASDLGTTTIERIHSAAIGNSNQGILRQYNIMPGQNNSGLSAALRLYYDETELNGLSEDGLRIFRSADGSNDSWDMFGGTENTAENYVEASGIAEFSYWTIANVNTPLPVEDSDDYLPGDFALQQNYPNPFNPETVIRFDVPKSSLVNISVYNLIGEKVAEILNMRMEPGVHSINFNAKDLSSGVYIYKLTADEFISSKKMIYLK